MSYYSTKLVGAAVGAVMALSAVGASADTRLLRYGDFGPNRGTRAEAMQWIDTELRKRTNDELGIDFVWGGALVGATTAVDSIADGVADMGSIVPVYSPGKLVTYELADAIQYADEWVGMNAVYDLMTTNADVQKEWDTAGLVYFGNFTTGPTQLLTKKPVKTLADLDGLTIRATGGFVPAFKSAGAGTVSLGQPKVYEALSNGTVDASTTYYYTVLAYKHYEQAAHVTELDMGQYLGFGIAMNKGTFESLSPEHQQVIRDLGRDFTKSHFAKIMWDARRAAREKLQNGVDGYKVEVHTPNPEMVPALAEIVNKDTAKWVEKAEKKKLPAESLLADYQALVDKYTAERDAKGYPWDQ
jgi:TRAP-type C4-dicarboxylate transport system substrate-binding protein